MKNCIVLKIVALALFLAVPITSIAATNIIYVNGINNTIYDAIKSKNKVKEILVASENHLGDKAKVFSIGLIYNPVGFYGIKEDEPNLKQDRQELFLLKTAEEMYGEDFQKIMVPFNESRLVDVEAAARVATHFDDMTPGANRNSLEADGLVSDEDMSGTQKATRKIVSTIKELGSAVVVAHSQGNLLANLAYAKIVSEFGDDASNKIRIVNVANTSEFSVNNLNFTHAGDEALYSEANLTLDYSLETLPSLLETWRTTPKCYDSDYNFVVAPPTFEAYSGGGFPWLSHGFVDVYLSEDNVYVRDGQGVAFTPGAYRFVDRFEDFVYAAAESLRFAELRNENGDQPSQYYASGACEDSILSKDVPDGASGFSTYVTPSSYPFHLSGVKIFFYSANTSGSGFYLHLLDDDGNDLLPVPMLIPHSEFKERGWWEKDISEFELIVNKGNIRISFFESYLPIYPCGYFSFQNIGWIVGANGPSLGRSINIGWEEGSGLLDSELMMRVSGSY